VCSWNQPRAQLRGRKGQRGGGATSVLEGGNVSISQLRTEMEKQMSWGCGGGQCAAQGEAARPVVTCHDGGETPSPDLFFFFEGVL
jgi:hypothetical protein